MCWHLGNLIDRDTTERRHAADRLCRTQDRCRTGPAGFMFPRADPADSSGEGDRSGRFFDDRRHDRGLAVGVCLPVDGPLLGQPQLHRFISFPCPCAAPENLAQAQVRAPLVAVTINHVQMGDSMPWSALENKNMPSLVTCVAPVDPSIGLQPCRHGRDRLLHSEADRQVDDRLGKETGNGRRSDQLYLRCRTMQAFHHSRPQIAAGIQPGLSRPAEPKIPVVEPQPHRGQRVHGRIVAQQ